MNLFNKFVLFFATKIEVRMTKDRFSFISKKGAFDIKTSVFLEKEGGHFKIASIGTENPDAVIVKRVDLFGNHQNADYDCLKKYIEHGLLLTTGKYALLRPSIVCKGVENFSEFFGGYQKGIFFNLFAEAGAGHIEFSDS